MFGFFIGTACAVGFVALAARHRHHHYGHYGHHRHGRRGGFRRRWLRRALERLDTTPGQEKAILTALDDLREHAMAAREDLGETRQKVADAIGEERLDGEEFGRIFDEPLERLRGLRDHVAKAAAKIHETLTPRQREKLSDFVGAGTRWGYGYGHGRPC